MYIDKDGDHVILFRSEPLLEVCTQFINTQNETECDNLIIIFSNFCRNKRECTKILRRNIMKYAAHTDATNMTTNVIERPFVFHFINSVNIVLSLSVLLNIIYDKQLYQCLNH